MADVAPPPHYPPSTDRRKQKWPLERGRRLTHDTCCHSTTADERIRRSIEGSPPQWQWADNARQLAVVRGLRLAWAVRTWAKQTGHSARDASEAALYSSGKDESTASARKAAELSRNSRLCQPRPAPGPQRTLSTAHWHFPLLEPDPCPEYNTRAESTPCVVRDLRLVSSHNPDRGSSDSVAGAVAGYPEDQPRAGEHPPANGFVDFRGHGSCGALSSYQTLNGC